MQHKPELDFLRKTIEGNGQLPEYSSSVDTKKILVALMRFGQSGPVEPLVVGVLPHDTSVQLFPGVDLLETGLDALIVFLSNWEATAPVDILGLGSMVTCNNRDECWWETAEVPFSLGMAVPCGHDDDSDNLVVAW